MIAYVDSSVLLRFVLSQPDRLAAWSNIDVGVTSALTRVECLRTIDRLHQRRLMTDEMLSDRRAHALRTLDSMVRVDISRDVLQRARDAFPTPLGSLDALHLASAVLWRESSGHHDLAFATHDVELARAAKACGLNVLGV